jgi:predicted nuclease of predicted toxin-antitoxin system
LRVLLDTCVWGGVRNALSDAGHDVIWSGDWPIDPGDEEILEQVLTRRDIAARTLVE